MDEATVGCLEQSNDDQWKQQGIPALVTRIPCWNIRTNWWRRFQAEIRFGSISPATELSDSEEDTGDASRKYSSRQISNHFFDYGEIEEDAVQMVRHLENVKEFSRRVTAQLQRSALRSLKLATRMTESLDMFCRPEYAKELVIRDGLKVIDSSYFSRSSFGILWSSFSSEICSWTPWTVKRGRLFINALIPSVFHSLHAEENLIDFMEDFSSSRSSRRPMIWCKRKPIGLPSVRIDFDCHGND